MRFLKPILFAVFALSPSLAAAAAGTPEPAPEITDVTVGGGETAIPYSRLAVHYSGWLMDGSKFDSSLDRDEPFRFTLGAGQVIAGWDMGVRGMRVGGKRILVIPPDLAYGKKGAGGVIPPNATLKFEVELISVIPPKFKSIDNAGLKELLAQGTKIVDIRRPDEWKKTGVVEGSKLLMSFNDKGRLSANFLPGIRAYAARGEPLILICRTGNRTGYISNLLSQKFGYSKIFNVEQGIVKWIAEGNKVVQP